MKWVVGLLICFPLFLNAQETRLPDSDIQESTLELLLEEAVFEASQGMWKRALSLLDEAERQFSQSEKIEVYRQAVEELRNLETVYDAGDIEQEESTKENNEIIEGTETQEPFVIARAPENRQKDIEVLRDHLRLVLGLKLLSTDSQKSGEIDVFNSLNSFLYSYLNLQIRAWFPLWGRSVGLMAESSGFEIRNFPILYNKISLGINIRGFLVETEKTRTEIGADLGVTMNNHLVRGQEERYYTPLLKVWIRDPLMYRLFNNDVLQNLIVQGYFGVYPTADGLSIDLLEYGFDLSWRISDYFLGVIFDWWDDRQADDGSRTFFSFSIFMGYRY